MRAFENRNVDTVLEAVAAATQAISRGQAVAFVGGGTDLLQLVKDRVPNRPGSGVPDVLVNLKTLRSGAVGDVVSGMIRIDALTTLTDLAAAPYMRDGYAVLAEAADSVATPQIRNVGTVGGNLAQRPWCWYYRNGFPCYKAGGDRCFSAGGENQLHAIFGGGPSYIVHPSDLAPAFVALDASLRIAGPNGERDVPIADFFVLPRQDARHENILTDDELIVRVYVPALEAGTRSTYRKIMDRETWTHALASAAVVLRMEGEICRSARIVLGGVAPVPWRVPAAEDLLAGQRITPDLARRIGEAAVAEARPLAKNAYKVPLTRKLVERTVLELATRA